MYHTHAEALHAHSLTFNHLNALTRTIKNKETITKTFIKKTLLLLQTKSNMTSLSTNTNLEIDNASNASGLTVAMPNEERKDEAVAWSPRASPTFGMWNNVEAKTREDETAKHLAKVKNHVAKVKNHLAKVKTVTTDYGTIYETETPEQAKAVLDHMLNQLQSINSADVTELKEFCANTIEKAKNGAKHARDFLAEEPTKKRAKQSAKPCVINETPPPPLSPEETFTPVDDVSFDEEVEDEEDEQDRKQCCTCDNTVDVSDSSDESYKIDLDGNVNCQECITNENIFPVFVGEEDNA